MGLGWGLEVMGLGFWVFRFGGLVYIRFRATGFRYLVGSNSIIRAFLKRALGELWEFRGGGLDRMPNPKAQNGPKAFNSTVFRPKRRKI